MRLTTDTNTNIGGTVENQFHRFAVERSVFV